jgi:hypothetical protein
MSQKLLLQLYHESAGEDRLDANEPKELCEEDTPDFGLIAKFQPKPPQNTIRLTAPPMHFPQIYSVEAHPPQTRL